MFNGYVGFWMIILIVFVCVLWQGIVRIEAVRL